MRKPSHSAPDFGRIYADPDLIVSPRMASNLWVAALDLADSYQDEDLWPGLMSKLPPIAQRLADEVWMRRFLGCFEALADRLARGDVDATQITACTGDEMALHLVIDLAEAGAKDNTSFVDTTLPEDPEGDTDFELVREVLFRDHDVLLLFNAALDGVEDADSELSEEFRFANLHPGQWFLPFADQPDYGSDG